MDDQKYNDLRRKVLNNMNNHRRRRPAIHSRTCSNPEILIPTAFAKSLLSLNKEEFDELADALKPTPSNSPTISPNSSPLIHRKKYIKKTEHSPVPEDISPILHRHHRRIQTLTTEITACLGERIIVHEA